MSPTEKTRHWIERLVVGVSICPFAKPVFVGERVRYEECHPDTIEVLLDDVIAECRRLDDEENISTTLLIYPEGLESFDDYLDVLEAATQKMTEKGYEGTYQLASFHPDYVFAGCEPDDAANLTNRAPYPMLHLLREAEITEALANFSEPQKIPERNMRVCRELGHEGLRLLLEDESALKN